ncbi:MAG: universal stress protein [Bacteroidota bacterium]
MKKILFPTDFSPAAENAYIYALQLARATDSCIIALHAYQLPSIHSAGLNNTITDYLEDLKLEEFENFKDKVPELRKIAEENGLEKVPNEHVLEMGEPKSTILRMARDEKADLIVMGTTGATGAKEIFLGSVAGEVLEKAPCPVLAVPQKAEFDGKIDRLAFTTNFSNEDHVALEWLTTWAKSISAKIEVIHVDLNHIDEFSGRMSKFQNAFAEHSNLTYTVVDSSKDFQTAISEYLETTESDFVAMVTFKRSFWQELFNKSQTKQLSYHMDLPIMAMPAALFQNS